MIHGIGIGLFAFVFSYYAFGNLYISSYGRIDNKKERLMWSALVGLSAFLMSI